MSNHKLSHKLVFFRVERPSEWLMDEFKRDAESLEKRIKELEEKLLKCTRENHKIVRQSSAVLASCGYVYDESREPELIRMEAKRDLEQRLNTIDEIRDMKDSMHVGGQKWLVRVADIENLRAKLRKQAEDL